MASYKQTSRTETLTKREVHHTRIVNGKVVTDDHDSNVDRNVEYETFSPKRLKGVDDSYGLVVNGASERQPLQTREMNFASEARVPRSYNAGYVEDTPVTHPSDAGSESSERDWPDGGRGSRGSYTTSGRDSPRRRGSAGSQTKSSSVSMPMTSGSLARKGGSPTDEVTYSIGVKVGEVKGDEANGNVYITLFGDKATTSKIQLRQAGDNTNGFIDGELYTFSVTTVDVGKIDRIKLSHDHMDFGSGFFVEEVQIQIPANNDDYTFPCNFWLSQERHESLPRTPRSPSITQVYNVSLELGRVYNPNAKLYLQLCGHKGESSKIVLRPTGGQTDEFQEGKVYKFSVEIPTVGKVNKIRIGHDSRGRDNGIYIDEMEVTPEGEDLVYFPAACWLAEDIGDGKMEREINMGHAPAPMGTDATHTVSVRLGEVLNYNAQLYIYLIGSRGETGRVPLKPDGPLERTKVYKFPLALNVDIGRITKIVLGQNSRGYGQGVFVDEVDVQPTNDMPVNFPCQCWLAEDVWDSRIERELLPGIAVEKPPNTTYELTFKTGDHPNAGTDANVTLQLFGDRGQTEKIMLRQKGRTLKRFDRGRTDKFDVQTLDVGNVNKVRISHDNSNPDPDWFLEKLTVGIPDREQTYHFPVDNWLTGDETDTRVELEMEPVFEEPIARVEREVKVMAELPFEPEPEKVLYTVSFTIGPTKDPFSRIYLILHGVGGDSEHVYLKPPHGSRLTSGKQYKLITEIPDVGKIESVTVGHDSPGPDKGVFIEEIDVSAPAETPTVFPCREWLSEATPEIRLVPGESETYEVLFTLGEVLDPDTKLYMIIYGDKGQDSGKLYLMPTDGSKFQKGRKYRVIAKMRDIGKINDVVIGQEGPGRGVFVEEVELRAKDKDPVLFPCRAWVDDSQPNGAKFRPGESLTTPYEIQFTLGEVLNPDADLYMVIHGRNGDSDRLYLKPTDGSKFQKGHTYRVVADIPDIGEIYDIELGQEGPGRGVFVEEVVVRPKGKDPVVFPCRAWLDENKNDGKKTRILRPGETTTLPYEIQFTLGEVLNPDADLYMVIHGDKGDSDRLYLKPTDGTKFQKGHTYRVVADIPDIGEIDEIELGQEGPGRGVFVEEVVVRPKGKDPVVFPCRAWLDESKMDGKKSRILRPGDMMTLPYEIIFKLGAVVNPDAKLYMVIHGSEAESDKLYLTPSDGSKFQKGRTYRVVANIPDVGEIENVELSVEGPGGGIFVEEVEVRAPGQKPVVFPSRCWLDDNEADGQTSRVLIPNEPAIPKYEDILYNATFETGDFPFANTTAKVFLQMYGDQMETGKIEFAPDDGKSKRYFGRGKTDKFAVETVDIGQLEKVRVGHDNTGSSPEWFLKQLTIEVPSKDETYVFPFNNWVAGGDVVEIQPEKSRTEVYTILMRLGEVLDPNAPVLIQLLGEHGESGKIQVKPGVKPTDKFERGKTYKLIAKVNDIGPLNGVRVSQDEFVPSKGLFVEEVDVTSSRGERSVFPVNCWTVPEDKIKLDELQLTGSEPDESYEVMLTTGNRPGAGTKANVFFQLFGDHGDTEEVTLPQGRFEPGGMDKFNVETKDVGKVERLRVGHDNTGPNPEWFLKDVVVDVPAKEERYVFDINQWVGGANSPCVEARPQKLKDLDYLVTIKTGEDQDAGTDANVFLQMSGEKGSLPKFLLREEGDKARFSRGRTDKFAIKAKDIGKLNQIRISRDDAGIKPGWQLDKVMIDIPDKDEHYEFTCRRWLRPGAQAADFDLDPEKPREDLYTVVTKVGDVRDPGVSPYFIVCGDKGETGKIMLRDGYRQSHTFMKDHTYKIALKCPDVGKIDKLRLGDDGGGKGRTMFVEEVTVIDKNGDETEFPCCCWLGMDDNYRPIVHELEPGTPAPQDELTYHLTILTADENKAGTEAKVYFRLFGDKGETSDIVLVDPSKFKKFGKGRADKFVVQTADVGKLNKMVIGHDNTGHDPQWLLEEVHVDIPSRDEHYVFRCGRWLRVDEKTNKDNTETVLFPDGPVVEKPIEEMIEKVQEAGPLQGAVPSEHDGNFMDDTDYELEFKTADEPDAGTDCNVHCSMTGEGGETREIQLGDNMDGQHFQPGQTDRFRVRARDVGKLNTFSVGHDNNGSQPQWLLDEVVVYHIARKERYVFKNNKWIGGRDNQVDLPLDSWTYCQLESQMPDIPDLLDYMQSGNAEKMINAGFYLQHLCYNDENVKDKVRSLGGIPIIVRCLNHSNEKVRYAAACVLRNLSSGTKSDQNKLAITDCEGIERLMEMLQRSEKLEHRVVVLVVLRNLSVLSTLRLRILKLCLHLLFILIIKTYSGWDRNASQRDPPKMDGQWSELLTHATRIVRNLSSAGTQAREDLRTEEFLIDCLVWVIRTGVRNKHWNDECVENCVCTMRNLSYRLESELDRDLYTDDEVQLDKAVVKEQQSQGCFAGCGGGKSKKKKKAAKNMSTDNQPNKGPATGPALLYQPITVRQYYSLLKNATNEDTLEGSAGAIHNLTACSWKWAIKIRGDTRREQGIPSIINLLKRQYDPTVRASAILLRNLSVDRENKRIIGEKGTGPLVNRLPTGEPREDKALSDATHVSIMCALYQLGKKSEKNAKLIRKTTGVRRMARISNSKDRYDSRMVRTANQTLASLSVHPGLKEQMKTENWDADSKREGLSEDFPEEFDKISAPSTPTTSPNRSWRDREAERDPDLYRIERQNEMYGRSPSSGSAGRESLGRRQPADHGGRGSTSGSHHGSELSDRQRSWGSRINDVPPPYMSDDSVRGSRGEVYEMKDRKPNGQPGRPGGKENVASGDNPDDWV